MKRTGREMSDKEGRGAGNRAVSVLRGRGGAGTGGRDLGTLCVCVSVCVCVCVIVTQLCPTFCNPVDCRSQEGLLRGDKRPIK